ncbi:MAG: G8 domain-containing protein, partial [bacterium]
MRLRIVLALALLFALAIGTISSPESLAEGTPKPTPTHPGSDVPAPRPAQPTPGPHPTSPPSTVSPTPAPTQATNATPTPRPTNAASASNFPRWSVAASWPNGRVPTRDNDVVIPAGRAIEIDTLTAEARTVTVDGTLRASRSAASRLSVFGNLIVRNQGVLDYGRPTDRVQVAASIRFFLDEARVMGGPVMDPMDSDVGLWAIDDARVFVHGAYRDAWGPLVETARAGSIEIRVDPGLARGWRVGDTVLIGPSNLRTGDTDVQDEVRRITADVGGGRFQLDSALRFNHEVLTVPWTDTWGVAYTERLAAKVANLTSNVLFEAADPNHRPHILFMERARHYVEDLAVANFSPMPKRTPMARYAWHQHQQRDGSRGSYLRRTRLYGGPGIGLSIHESYGVEVEDLVIYNQARASVQLSNGTRFTNTTPLILERSGGADTQHHAADDCWIDRALIIRWGAAVRDYRNAGIWLNGSLNCPVMGAVTAGGGGEVFSSGMHWDEGGGGGEYAHV